MAAEIDGRKLDTPQCVAVERSKKYNSDHNTQNMKLNNGRETTVSANFPKGTLSSGFVSSRSYSGSIVGQRVPRWSDFVAKSEEIVYLNIFVIELQICVYKSSLTMKIPKCFA